VELAAVEVGIRRDQVEDVARVDSPTLPSTCDGRTEGSGVRSDMRSLRSRTLSAARRLRPAFGELGSVGLEDSVVGEVGEEALVVAAEPQLRAATAANGYDHVAHVGGVDV